MNSFNSKKTLNVNGKSYTYYSLPAAAETLGINLADLPYSMKILFENLLRNEDGKTVKAADVKSIADWLGSCTSNAEIAYRPARVLMQDFTGVPAVVDLAAMRDAVKSLGGDAQKINPQVPVDLVIDHSVMVDNFGTKNSFADNVAIEMSRNAERYKFLKWGQGAFENFRVVPPGTGICHQVNLEYLAHVVMGREVNGELTAYPDTCVGTDSHTTMINGLAVLGWGVGGIEAEAAMLGQPISMLLPEVIGFKLTGLMTEGTTATDLVLTVTQMLRDRGVVGKFVEFYGDGIHNLSLADRATIANMAPEYGATCGFFPVDEETINYMKLSSRDEDKIALTEAYAKAQGMWHDNSAADPKFTDSLALDISTVVPTIAGPKNPQERISLSDAARSFRKFSREILEKDNRVLGETFKVKNKDYELAHGNIYIAAITSCTNTSNPSVMIAAGLVAQKANALGLKVAPWVKTSLAPGSKVVTEYLDATNLSSALDELGFNLVGYGCTTCIGNSGPLAPEFEEAISEHDLIATSVLSGNRNFEGRVHPKTKGNYLMSPPLVVAYAIVGNMKHDIAKDPLGEDQNGNMVYLKDIWPSNAEVQAAVNKAVTPEMFASKYADVFSGTEEWQKIATSTGETYDWDNTSTYIQNPPYFEGMTMQLADKNANVSGATMLALLGDFITTDHISPAGVIAKNGPAAEYLAANDVAPADFNSFGSRRGNHEVMMRGTFANVKIKNELVPGTEGGITKYLPTGKTMSIYDAAMKYKESDTPLVIFGGKSYGMGSSRDWAAKGTTLLGIKAVIAESFERIHRSNLVGMGVLPLMFKEGTTRETLKLDGSESFAISGLENGTSPKMDVTLTITRADGNTEDVPLLCRIDTADEVEYFENGGILQNVIRGLCS